MTSTSPGSEDRAYGLAQDGVATLQRFGGAAAFAVALAIVLQTAVWMFYVPSLGIEDRPGDPANDVQMFLTARPGLLAVAAAITLAAGFAIVLVRALDERLRSGSPILVSTASVYGYLGWGLLALAGAAMFNITREVGGEYLPRPQAEQAMPALNGLVGSLFTGALFFVNVWLILASAAAFRGVGLPRWLAVLGILAGAFDLFNNFVELVEAPPVLILIWMIAAGVELLRRPAVGVVQR